MEFYKLAHWKENITDPWPRLPYSLIVFLVRIYSAEKIDLLMRSETT